MRPPPLRVGLLLNFRDAIRSATCAKSLLDNDVSHVIVWDNSEDGGQSAEMLVRAFESEPRVHVHVSPHNLGFAASVNRCLELCRSWHPGSRVLLINNDATLLPGGFSELERAVEEHPTALLAHPAIVQSDGIRRQGFYHRQTGLLFSHRWPGCFVYASGCCLLLATERMDDEPLFDEDFFMYGEDAELAWRLSRRSGAMHFVDQPLVLHEGSASSGLGSPFYEAHMVAAHLILARKLARTGAGVVLLMALRMPVLVARAVVRSLRFRSGAPFRALAVGVGLARRSRRKGGSGS